MEVEKVNSSTDLKHGSASDIDVECTIPDAFEVNELNTQKTIDGSLYAEIQAIDNKGKFCSGYLGNVRLVVDGYTVTDKSIELPHGGIVFFEDGTGIVELDEPFVFHKN